MRLQPVILLMLLFCLFGCEKEKVEVNQDIYPLPGNQLFPEGIAYDPKNGFFYTGSTINGDIIKVNVETGAAALFASGPKQGRADCRGMKLDGRDRLWVCGGEENKIHVLDGKGMLIKSWDVKAMYNSGFLNDCALDGSYVYFTDSRVQKIYRAGLNGSEPGNLEEWLVFNDQQIPYNAGFNANGIALTPDGKYIIIVVSNSGKLYRIDRNSKAIVEISLNTPVTSGDGLWLEKNTLYVSRNALNKIFPVVLSSDYTKGNVGQGFGDNLLFNTTIAKAGNFLLVVNGQLNRRPSGANPTPPAPVLPFSVSRVTIP